MLLMDEHIMLGPQDLLHWDLVPIAVLILIIAIPFLYDSPKSAIRYHGCYVVYIATVSITSIGCIPLFCLNPLNVKNILHISKLLKHVTKLIGITWELRNGEILAEERGAVIVANHQSMIDILGMFNIWEVMDKCAAIAKKEIFYVWPFGLAAWLGGVVYIDRLNGPKAHEQIDKAAKLSVTHKVKLWIFPEGTRNDGGDNMLPFKRGAFKVAIGCQVPIIPVVFSPYYFINHKKRYFGQGKIIITALPPISTEGLTMDDIDDVMERTRKVMVEAQEAVCKEVRSTLPSNYINFD
uniref:1-acyl-sn-glycerol-3-phosphate acyltransferase n=1 Tax=Timema cristinae TaxID=61476 RepID=A0A7R9GXR5_TIMCR|nr:unnamed protein product [Timema cristinae]